MIIVSACLLGENCRYDGKNCFNQEIYEFVKNKKVVKVCPEVFSGFGTPRTPIEIIKYVNNIKVISKDGKDVTKRIINGCKECFDSLKGENIEYAILKSKSPTCGFGKVYDGSFNGRIINGNGVFAEMLKQNGIKIYNENNYKTILGK
jgi:uncharacterized protein YbbK (DUF523 family)